MRMQEYQSKSLFSDHGIPIPRGHVVTTPEEAGRLVGDLGSTAAIKAQVPVGGRGKAGGVQLVATPAQAEEVAAAILGMTIRELPVRRLLVEEAVEVVQELYLAIVVDRSSRRAVMMASAEGGVDVEQVAHDHPEAVFRVAIDPLQGLGSAPALALADSIGLAASLRSAFDSIARRLYEVFVVYDALLAEINPLVITSEGNLLALDSKVVVDDNALFRHPDLAQMGVEAALDAGDASSSEVEAHQAGLSYVHLGGGIGCVVNGAGLAMATMDVINYFGGSPANFLDVGGGASAERVAAAMHLVLRTPGISAVLVNIFGGITLCDEVAQGIVSALDEATLHMPLVVRLVGTNEERGREILSYSGHQLVLAETLAEAAEMIVAMTNAESAT